MLFSHRAPCTAPGRVTRQPKVRSGFSGQTLAAPQVFYRESPSQIERAGGLELPLGTRSAASQHGGPVSPFELVTAQLRHDVLRRDHACARSAWGCGLVLEVDGGDTRPARNRACG